MCEEGYVLIYFKMYCQKLKEKKNHNLNNHINNELYSVQGTIYIIVIDMLPHIL